MAGKPSKHGHPTPSQINELRRAREQLGLSQSELARLSGANQSYISAYERHQRVPTLPWADRVAHVLDLLGGDVCWHPRENGECSVCGSKEAS